jgi:glycosyltransferase involved in cell wall biosynthesis
MHQGHRSFLARLRLRQDRPIVLCPVRIFRVKGVEIAVRFFEALVKACEDRGDSRPYLLVFGSLDEEPTYANEIVNLVRQRELADDVRFLDGVPLWSHRDRFGEWQLDEIDLLYLCSRSYGGVVFTPSRKDVESVGLGPALAGVAAVPCAITDYHAFSEVYGSSYHAVRFSVSALSASAEEFARCMTACRRDGSHILRQVRANGELLKALFPTDPWRDLLHMMSRSGLSPQAPGKGP